MKPNKEDRTLFETPRLRIRECTEEDAEALQKILGDPEVMRYSLKGALDQSEVLEYLRERILFHYEKHGYGLWALIDKQNGELIGLAGLINQVIDGEECVELGYRVARKYWGLGLATEAAIGIRDYAFGILGIGRLISIIEPANKRSVKVAQKAGMSRSKSTQFHGFDVDIYEICQFVEYS